MSRERCLDFVMAVRDSGAMLAKYDGRNLSQLLFHAKNEGYDFSAEDLTGVVSALEANVVLVKDQDTYSGSSKLWRQMWGKRHLHYLIEHNVRRHTDGELRQLIAAGGRPD